MRYLSKSEFEKKMREEKIKNNNRIRLAALKNERRKYNPIFVALSQMNTSTRVLIASIIAIVCYTVAAIMLQYSTGIGISDTLTTLWYSFWTVEIVALAGIKVSKVRHQEPFDDNDGGDACG